MRRTMVHREEYGSVRVLRLDHGKVAALDIELLADLDAALAAAEHDAAPAIVLTGTGGSFSAGVDLYRVLDGGPEYVRRFLPLLEHVLGRLFRYPRPVVAAVNGHAIAGGCILACACDGPSARPAPTIQDVEENCWLLQRNLFYMIGIIAGKIFFTNHRIG